MSPATHPELVHALAQLAGPDADPATSALLGLPAPTGRACHTDVFVLETHPYASVHLGAEGMVGGEAEDRVAGFWRTLGLVPPASADELTTLLELYARLGEEELDPADGRRRAAVASARGALLWEHLASWVPVHLSSVRRLGDSFYAAWADLLAEALAGEVDARPPRAELPSALAFAPPALDLTSRRSLLDGVLAPVRSGMVLTRSDLVRASDVLGVGVRRGERRFALEALVDQEPAGTLAWLGGVAEEWAEVHRATHPGPLAPIGEWWARRADRAAALLVAAGDRVAAPVAT